jgi:arsenate reductase
MSKIETTPPNANGTGILFLCVANSSRSQMAEGLANDLAPSNVEIFSAGSVPTQLNRFAVLAMQDAGLDISQHRSKSVDEIDKAQIGVVVTLCAEEVCPVFPSPEQIERHHWPFEDPAAAVGSDAERLAAFIRVRKQIAKRLHEYLGQP